MSDAPKKRSVTLHGHRTSVSLEDAFWQAFCGIARERGVPVNALTRDVDDARAPTTGLATAIRLFVLRYYQDRVNEA